MSMYIWFTLLCVLQSKVSGSRLKYTNNDFSVSYSKTVSSDGSISRHRRVSGNNSTYDIIDEYPGHVFDGIGALSGGGATSRLLINYPEPYRSQILDYLFKPKFGASLQIFKVEIGGDGQSTEGTEPSHMHSENEENYTRGYEWWLMKEAKARNPDITLVGLPWSFPGWIGQGTALPYANRSLTASYVVNWIRGAKQVHGLHINYVGIWNERPYDVEYIKVLRKCLDNAGFKSVGIIAADGAQFVTISGSVLTDEELSKSVAVLGAHYPGTLSGRLAHKTGKPLWSSEDYSTYNDAVGAGCWARILNQNYINGNMTATIAWNLIASYYDQLPFNRCSLMTANEPWSGNYQVSDPLWVTAHTTQFTKPGWRYLTNSGHLKFGGSFVGLTDHAGQLTIVIETMSHDRSKCIRPPLPGYTVADQTANFHLDGDFRSLSGLHMWRTQLGSDAGERFAYQGVLAVNKESGIPTVTVDLPVDTLITLTTVADAVKGSHPPPPASHNFPFPYSEDFEPGDVSEASNFADQAGSFELFRNSTSVDHPTTLRQVVTQRPVTWCDDPDSTLTVIGDYTWAHLNVSIQVEAENANGIFVALRVDKGGCASRQARGVFFWLMKDCSWLLTSDLNRVNVIKRCSFDWNSCQWKPSYNAEWTEMGLAVTPTGRLLAYLNRELVADVDLASHKFDIPATGWVALGTADYARGQFDRLRIRPCDK